MKKLLLLLILLTCTACSAHRSSAERFAKPKYHFEKRYPRDP